MQKIFCTLFVVWFVLLCTGASAADLNALKADADTKAAAAANAVTETQQAYEKLEAANDAATVAEGECARALGAFVSAETALKIAIDAESENLQKLQDAEAELIAKKDEVTRLADVFKQSGEDSDRDALVQAAIDARDAELKRDSAKKDFESAQQQAAAANDALSAAVTESQTAKQQKKDADAAVEQLKAAISTAERRSDRSLRHAAIAASSYQNALQDDKLDQQSATITAQKTEIDQLRTDLVALKQSHDNLVNTVNDKANTADVDAALAMKAERSELSQLESTLKVLIATKADQSALDATNARLAALELKVQSEIESLRSQVASKNLATAEEARKLAERLNNAESRYTEAVNQAKDAKATYEAALALRKQLENVITVQRTVYVDYPSWRTVWHPNGYWWRRYCPYNL